MAEARNPPFRDPYVPGLGVKTCGSCLFHNHYNCQRHAPGVYEHKFPTYSSGAIMWPQTQDGDWCGDWELKHSLTKQCTHVRGGLTDATRGCPQCLEEEVERLRAALSDLVSECDDYFHGDLGFPVADSLSRARKALVTGAQVEPEPKT